MAPLVEAVRGFFARHRIDPCPVLVAVSGGPDSTALLLALQELETEGFTVSAGHVNHGLRGEEADADEAFVRDTASRLGVPLQVVRAEPDPSAVSRVGVEAAAREVRYRALAMMRTLAGADYAATAHTRNDQAETLLMRLMTGSGLQRLQGIRPLTNDAVIRPLLDCHRSDVESYLTGRGFAARSDSTNRESRFLRNRIRAEVLPLLESLNPRIIDTLAETADLARAERQIIDSMLAERESAFVVESAGTSRFLLDKLPQAAADAWLVARALHRQIRRLDPAEREVSAPDLRRLTVDLPGLKRTTVSGRLELIREGNAVVLRRRPLRTGSFERPIEPGQTVEIDEIGATLTLRLAEASGPEAAQSQPFQLPDGGGGFVVRNRRPGDRFQPLGMSSPKSLSDFLIDRKVPRADRDRIPLLLWNGEIVWVGGVEVSERFKVADQARQILAADIEWRR